MHKPRMAVLAAIAAVVAMVLVPATAGGEPNLRIFRGDVNGDRIVDQVLPAIEAGGGENRPCVLSIALGKRDGTLGTPKDYSYDSPRTSAPFCPDMGVVADLRGDGKPDIITTGFQWYSGGYLTLRLVRDEIRVTGLYPGLPFPSTIRTTDFNGDGLPDVWSSSDQSMEIRSFHSTPDGAIVPGTVSGCSSQPVPQHFLADFDGDGGQDMLLSRRCEYASWAAELHFGSGKAAITFAKAQDPHEVFVTDIGSDGVPDIGLISHVPQLRVQHFRNDGTGNFMEV
ncbi:VCBS repeat-containing protein [Actinokineospora sp. NBRC 105648]|uniref:FG-GAP repeat domain-containing protein n=1 Tax=Actinokineospora sp. NBRC 105648 TaxID=3032206 RepID=UPI0024A28BE5|nr:VCBS repeat-containing protein [Actinokineospora sp. NBRC 105648]GLZ38145.1 hypothetical protein Acsp05_17690 [Actinokineospora sp. NBRC 105648]